MSLKIENRVALPNCVRSVWTRKQKGRLFALLVLPVVACFKSHGSVEGET
jgi:hypothetical protein